MKLYDDSGRNQSAWSRRYPIHGYRCQPAPAAGRTVLAWNPAVENSYGKLPLISHHLFGKGRVMLVGMDSTWLWRRKCRGSFLL